MYHKHSVARNCRFFGSSRGGPSLWPIVLSVFVTVPRPLPCAVVGYATLCATHSRALPSADSRPSESTSRAHVGIDNRGQEQNGLLEHVVGVCALPVKRERSERVDCCAGGRGPSCFHNPLCEECTNERNNERSPPPPFLGARCVRVLRPRKIKKKNSL